MRGSNKFRPQFLTGGSIGHPCLNKGGKALLVKLLQLAAAAIPEVPAWRGNMVRPRLNRPIGQQHIARSNPPGKSPSRGYAIALCGNSDDLFGLLVFRFTHRQAA